MKLSLSELKEHYLPNPVETVKELDKYVIGQDQAKKTLALLLLNRTIIYLQHAGYLSTDVKIQKTNAMLIGPSGTGKTALIKALSAISDIPILMFDVTSLTATGYHGADTEEILYKHVQLVKQYFTSLYGSKEFLEIPETAYERQGLFLTAVEHGIIFLDEFDKIRRRETRGADVNGDMIQNELLKIVEGSTVSIKKDTTDRREFILQELDTTNITFIVGGAFAGLDEIIKQRLSAEKGGIGFNSNLVHTKDNSEIMSKVTTDDLVMYGFKPELLGRLPTRALLDPLTVDVMLRIITEPVDSIYSQYQALFKIFDIDLEIEPAALREIAKIAIQLKLGARSLKYIFTRLFEFYTFNVFDYSDKKLIITKQDVVKYCETV